MAASITRKTCMIENRPFARYKYQHHKCRVFRDTTNEDYFSEEIIRYEFLTGVSGTLNTINLFSEKESIPTLHENTKLVSNVPKQNSLRSAEIAKLESIPENKISIYDDERELFNVPSPNDIHDCFMVENTKVPHKYNKSQRHMLEPETHVIEKQALKVSTTSYMVPIPKSKKSTGASLTPITIGVADTIGVSKSKNLLKVLLDPGSTKTLISKKVIPRNASPANLQKRTRIRTIAGTMTAQNMVNLTGIRLPEFDKNRKIDNQKALIFDQECRYDLILGADFFN